MHIYISIDYEYNLVFPYAHTFGLLVRVVSSFVSKESSTPKDHGKQRGMGYEMQMRFLLLHRHGYMVPHKRLNFITV